MGWPPYRADVEVDYDDGVPFAASPVLTFFVSDLECQACGLKLDGPDEISASEMEQSWRNKR